MRRAKVVWAKELTAMMKVRRTDHALRKVATTYDRVMAEARDAIREAIRRRGSFTHNVISSALRVVAGGCGTIAADKLVDEFKLTKRFGIRKAVRDAKT